jgi:hypothetical protein
MQNYLTGASVRLVPQGAASGALRVPGEVSNMTMTMS